MNPVLRRIITTPRPKIYGALWDKGNGSSLVRTDSAANLVANVGVDMAYARNDFEAYADIFKDIADVADSYGNVFVRIPKLYIHKTDMAARKTWQISKTKINHEWYLPWCFWDFANGRELPYVDVGKYNASLSADNKLESKPGKYPLVNKTIVDFRTYAQANGAGYQQIDIHIVDILRTLFFIMFATIDSQSIMGGWTGGSYSTSDTATVTETGVNRIVVSNAVAAKYAVGQPISIGTSLGNNQICYDRDITAVDVYDASNKAVSFDGASVNISVGNILYNSGWKSGFSSIIAARNGSIGSNITGKFPCVFLGIENPFGNVWQFADGININNNQSWICKNAANYASNVFASPYDQMGYVNSNANGYINETGYDSRFPFLEIPASIQASSTIKYKDYYYQSSGQKIALFGGSWLVGSNAGLSYWSLNYASSDAGLSFGCRLAKKPL